MGIGRYSRDSTAFCLLQHFALACPFWLFRPEVLRQRFFVFCFLGQVVLGGFANRNSIDNQCPGNKHLLLNFLVLLIREALTTLQRCPVSPAEMLTLLCSLSPPPPPMHKPQQQRHTTAIPSPLPRHLPLLSLFSSSKERESQVLVSFFFFLKQFSLTLSTPPPEMSKEMGRVWRYDLGKHFRKLQACPFW